MNLSRFLRGSYAIFQPKQKFRKYPRHIAQTGKKQQFGRIICWAFPQNELFIWLGRSASNGLACSIVLAFRQNFSEICIATQQKCSAGTLVCTCKLYGVNSWGSPKRARQTGQEYSQLSHMMFTDVYKISKYRPTRISMLKIASQKISWRTWIVNGLNP